MSPNPEVSRNVLKCPQIALGVGNVAAADGAGAQRKRVCVRCRVWDGSRWSGRLIGQARVFWTATVTLLAFGESDVSPNVPKYHQMSPNVPKCPEMSPNPPKHQFEDIWGHLGTLEDIWGHFRTSCLRASFEDISGHYCCEIVEEEHLSFPTHPGLPRNSQASQS